MTEEERERRRRVIARLANEQRYASQFDRPAMRDIDGEHDAVTHKRLVADGLGAAWVARSRGLIVGHRGDLPRSRR